MGHLYYCLSDWQDLFSNGMWRRDKDPEVEVERARATGDSVREAMLSGAIALGLQEAERYDEAVEWYGRAIDAFMQHGDMQGVGIHLYNLGVIGVLTEQDDWATTYFTNAVSVLRTAGTEEELATALESVSTQQINAGPPSEAIPTILEILSIRRRLGQHGAVPRVLELLGEQHQRAGEMTAVLRTADEALECAAIAQDPDTADRCVAAALAIQTGLSGHPDRLAAVQRAAAVADRLARRDTQAASLWNLGNAHFDAGDGRAAELVFRRCRTMYRELKRTAEVLKTTVILADILFERGEARGAITELEPVLSDVRATSDTDVLNVCLVRLASAHRAVGADSAAVPLFDEAAQLRLSLTDTESAAMLLLAAADASAACDDHDGVVIRAQRAVSLRPDDDAVRAMACGRLVEAYGALANRHAMEASLRDGLAAARSAADPREEVLLLSSRAAVAQGAFELQDAARYFTQAVAPARDANDARLLTETLLRAGVALVYAHDDERARPLLTEALTAARVLDAPDLEGSALINLGRIETSSDAERLGLLRLAREKARAVGDEWQIATALLHAAIIHRGQGDYEAALAALDEALALARSGGFRDIEGQVLDAMGVIWRYLNDFGNALALHREALELHRALGDDVAIQRTIESLGTVHLVMGEVDEALSYYSDALVRAKSLGVLDESTELFNKSALGLMQLHRYAEAVTTFERGLDVARRRGDRSQEATIHNNLGAAYAALDGGLDRTLETLRAAVKIAAEEGLRPLEGKARNQLGGALLLVGESRAARAEICAGLELARLTGLPDDEMSALANLGKLHEDAGEIDAAIDCYRRAVAILERIRLTPAEREVRERILSANVSAYQDLVFALIRRGDVASAFASAEAGKARGALDLLAEAVGRLRRGVDPDLRAAETRLHAEIFALRRRVGADPDGEGAALAIELRTLEERLADVARDIRLRTPAYADLTYPDALELDDVRAVLAPGEVLIEFVFDATRLAGFVVGSHDASVHRFDEAEELIIAVRTYVLAFQRADVDAYDSELAKQLYERLLGPIEDRVLQAAGDDPSGVVIVPDGILHYLPIESLIISNDGPRPRYLIHDHDISYAPSASVLAASRQPRERRDTVPHEVLALAPFASPTDPHYPGAGRQPLPSRTLRSLVDDPPPLPASASELDAITACFPDALCLRGADATQEAFETHCRASRYVHLATHGYLDSKRPAYSGLLLSGDVLQTYELFDLELDADLTVLSACETGLGRLRDGEGLVGLTRAFLYAGSPSVIVSLWRVADASTAALVGRLYRNLRAGADPRAALADAKRWMLNHEAVIDEFGYEVRYDHPFYWAPFVLIGAGLGVS